MPLKFRKNHPHLEGAYQVIHEGIAVGAVTWRKIPQQGEAWFWEIYLFGRLVAGNSGHEATSDQAVAALQAAWDRSVTPADLEWIRTRAFPPSKSPLTKH